MKEMTRRLMLHKRSWGSAGKRGRLISSIESSRAERKKSREAILKLMFALVKKIQERERASKGALPRKILFLHKRSWVLAGPISDGNP